jgi:hypothetical protein
MFTPEILSKAEKTWITEAGYPAAVVIQPLGHRCGYVALPKSHPAASKHYDDLEIYVHGGLTYGVTTEEGAIFGFDCAHYTDRPDPALMSDECRAAHNRYSTNYGVIRTLEFCIEQCEDMARQFKELE